MNSAPLNRIAVRGRVSAEIINYGRNPEDGRSSWVVSSESGLSLMDGLIKAHVQNQKAAVSHLLEVEQQQLSDLLKKLLKYGK